MCLKTYISIIRSRGKNTNKRFHFKIILVNNSVAVLYYTQEFCLKNFKKGLLTVIKSYILIR